MLYILIKDVVALPHHTGLNLFLRHGRQQQQHPQQQQPDMIDKTRSKNTTSSAIRSAVLRDSHQRIKPVHRRKDTLMGVLYIRDIHRRIQGNNAGMRPPPHPGGEVFVFVLTSIICLPNQSVTQFLSGAPPFKKNPGSALNYWCNKLTGYGAFGEKIYGIASYLDLVSIESS